MVAPIAILHLLTPISKVHLVTPLYTDDVYHPCLNPKKKFGRNLSRRAGDIKDFSKSKMAAMPDLVQRLKLTGNISVASV